MIREDLNGFVETLTKRIEVLRTRILLTKKFLSLIGNLTQLSVNIRDKYYNNTIVETSL